MYVLGKVGLIAIATLVSVLIVVASTATAARLTSPNYQLDTNLGGNFGGMTQSSSYTMTTIGGEALVGGGTSSSYKLAQTFDTSAPAIEVSVLPTDIALGMITSGESTQADMGINVHTDATEYSLSVQQNHDLQTTNSVATIPGIGATTAVPQSWNEGTTAGLGYSLVAAPLLDTKWGAGTKYAAIPDNATTIYHGVAGEDDLTMRFRLDVTKQQQAGDYTNTVTITGTMIP